MEHISITISLILMCIIYLQLGSALVLVKNVEEGSTVTGNQDIASQAFEIFCYRGRSKHILHMWETVQLQLSLHPDEFTLFIGYNPDDVKHKYDHQKTTWNFNIFSKRQYIKLNPFNQTCVGILASKNYEVKLQRIRVDYWRILICICGFIIFRYAPTLSTNTLFYYLTGISLGICASILIFVYVLSRFMPRKPMMYSFLTGGWIVGVYIVQFLWENVKVIAIDYKYYVIYYILGTGFISFIICYKYGPVSDPRNINLIRWTLQGAGMLLILTSSDFQEAAMLMNILLIIYYYLPLNFLWKFLFKIKRWWIPPRQRLLTEDEYHLQGVVETEKALDSLRQFCSSPDCNQWRTILKLKKPLGFAKFMEGSSHLEDEEILAFETDTKIMRDGLLTDDSTSSSD